MSPYFWHSGWKDTVAFRLLCTPLYCLDQWHDTLLLVSKCWKLWLTKLCLHVLGKGGCWHDSHQNINQWLDKFKIFWMLEHSMDRFLNNYSCRSIAYLIISVYLYNIIVKHKPDKGGPLPMPHQEQESCKLLQFR